MTAKASVEWLPDGSAKIILPDIEASSPEEAEQIARRLIAEAAREAGLTVQGIEILNTEPTG